MIQRKLAALRPWHVAVWLLAVFGLLAGISGLAQSGRGTLSGTITDSTGAIISGASVDLKETNTGSGYSAVANGQGLFTFPQLPPGTYSLTVGFAGFQSYKQDGITVNVGSTATVDVVLQVGAATSSVTVSGDASHLQTESSDIGTTVPSELIEDLPASIPTLPQARAALN